MIDLAKEREKRRSPDPRRLDELRDLTQEEFDEYADWCGWSKSWRENVVWWMKYGWRYFERPVPVREFLFDRAYMHALDEAGAPFLWPACVQAVEDICTGNYVEALLTGGIGVGKSTIGDHAWQPNTATRIRPNGAQERAARSPAREQLRKFVADRHEERSGAPVQRRDPG